MPPYTRDIMETKDSRETSTATENGKPTAPPRAPKKKKQGRKPHKAIGLPAKRSFPSVSLQDALILPQKLKLNGGNPWPPSDLANAATGKSHKTPAFFYLTAAARDYGLTVGTNGAAEISLGEIGKKWAYAGNPETEREALREAFFHVPIFKHVFEHYKGPSLPELKFVGNTLESKFGLAPEFHEDFHRLFQENCRFLEIQGAYLPETSTALPTNGSTSSIVTLGSPSKGSTLRAFVALPFSEKTGKWPVGFFSEVLSNLITPAGVEAGFKVDTARKEGSDVIQATIVNDLVSADLVIADLTEHNPNVLFELGMRMAFDKPVALIRAYGTPPIFDIDNMLRVYEYSPNLWKSTLESDIPKLCAHIKGTWDGRKTGKSYLQILKEQHH
jgi:hypothetical protein